MGRWLVVDKVRVNNAKGKEIDVYNQPKVISYIVHNIDIADSQEMWTREELASYVRNGIHEVLNAQVASNNRVTVYVDNIDILYMMYRTHLIIKKSKGWELEKTTHTEKVLRTFWNVGRKTPYRIDIRYSWLRNKQLEQRAKRVIFSEKQKPMIFWYVNNNVKGEHLDMTRYIDVNYWVGLITKQAA